MPPRALWHMQACSDVDDELEEEEEEEEEEEDIVLLLCLHHQLKLMEKQAIAVHRHSRFRKAHYRNLSAPSLVNFV